MSEFVLKTLACQGLFVGSSKPVIKGGGMSEATCSTVFVQPHPLN